MDESLSYGVVIETLSALPRDAAYVGMILLLLIVARYVKDLMTPFSIREEMTIRDNAAVGLSMAGYYAAVILICTGPLYTAPPELLLSPAVPDPTGAAAAGAAVILADVPLWLDVLRTAGYAVLGIILLNIARVLVDRLLLRDFSTVKEIVRDRNAGTGAVEMGAYIASGLVIAGALQGQGGGVHTVVAFFALGQLGLVIYGMIYRVLCRYDLHREIERDNVAAGVAFGLNLVAMGLITMKAASGDFFGWGEHVLKFATIYAVGVVFLLIVRLIIDYALLPGVKLQREIVEDRNLNAAWVEGVVLAGMAGILAIVL